MKKYKTLFLILFLCYSAIQGQDIITKKDGSEIKVIIKKVTKNTIKYVLFDDPNGVLFTIDKVLLREVKFAYGENLNVKNPEKDSNYFSEDRTGNILFNFSAFANNTLGLSYEKNIKLGQSIMTELKIYGLGVTPEFELERSGFGIDFFYKLKTKSLFNKGEYRPKHILHGPYFSPVVGFSTGKLKMEEYYGTETISHTVVHFGLQYGNQWILDRTISVDASFGFHYYFGNSNDDIFDAALRLGNMIGGGNVLIGLNLRIGFLTGKRFTEK
ncbi:hypothetical protein OD91_2246 [Lutibacter sp. Hel_I_33_5]|uniref:hypothetical protein n=1 Tax=Lutibacter sp. Hel_I_33_5 TaxID=1566289 RepID=UPI0011AA0B82|nr:hypothetical protein [Lutibacter sp. Hel_I_33_5]TVZ56943.1 hypothetical protein OD91_2246 [Lutibacter sp. Hel_I_33_5]